MTIADCGVRIADWAGWTRSWRTLAVVCAGAVLAAPVAAQTSLSIYRDGRVLVRRTLPEALRRGTNTVTMTMEGVDPATLFSPDTSVTVLGAVTRYPTTVEQALARAAGQTLSFARERDTVRATVVRVAPPQFRLADGRMLLQAPGTPLFPEGLVRTTPQTEVTLEASRGRQRTELAFVGQGTTWEAVYQVVLGGTVAAVSGAATIASQSLRVDTAEVQLVAGSIRRARGGPMPSARVAMELAAAPADGMPAAEETVGETHVYTLPGRTSIEPGVPVTAALFPRATAPIGQEFIVPGAIPWRGYFGPTPYEPNLVPVQVWYTVRRPRGSAFGDRPLPAGTAQIYQPDAEGRVQLVGEAAVGHTPVGRDVRLQAGDAFDVTAERVQTDYSAEQIAPPRRGLPATQRITASYRVIVTSAKSEAIVVDVRETHVGEWRVTASSVRAERLSSSEFRFRLSVPANGTVTLTYTVQIDS